MPCKTTRTGQRSALGNGRASGKEGMHGRRHCQCGECVTPAPNTTTTHSRTNSSVASSIPSLLLQRPRCPTKAGRLLVLAPAPRTVSVPAENSVGALHNRPRSPGSAPAVNVNIAGHGAHSSIQSETPRCCGALCAVMAGGRGGARRSASKSRREPQHRTERSRSASPFPPS